jgi:hypothetical protein
MFYFFLTVCGASADGLCWLLRSPLLLAAVVMAEKTGAERHSFALLLLEIDSYNDTSKTETDPAGGSPRGCQMASMFCRAAGRRRRHRQCRMRRMQATAMCEQKMSSTTPYILV